MVCFDIRLAFTSVKIFPPGFGSSFISSGIKCGDVNVRSHIYHYLKKYKNISIFSTLVSDCGVV